ncbi:MAG: aminomethyltransferase beta-barrel domain-containing protein [Cypionkella sp.]
MQGVPRPLAFLARALAGRFGSAPGQAAVVYDGTRVVGSATIAATS